MSQPESNNPALPDDTRNASPLAPVASSSAERLLPSTELFRGQREVWIEHDGVRYRLRITRRNRLILQK